MLRSVPLSLRRKTNSNKFISELDGLRFFAIITVMIFHLNTSIAEALDVRDVWDSNIGGKSNLFSLAWWLVRLDLGVKVFFSISGFVLALPFLKNLGQIKFKPYFERRITRLEPPFMISLLTFYLIHIFFLDAPKLEYTYHLLAGIFYLHVPIYGFPNPINPVSWSLETEAQFYLIVPFLFLVFFKIRSIRLQVIFLIILLIAGVFFRSSILKLNLLYFSNSIFSYLSNFVVGIGIAWLYLSYPAYFKFKSFLFDALGLISMLSLFYFYKPQVSMVNLSLFNLSVAGLFLATFKGRLYNWFFTRPVIYTIGGMCYSIYLLHYAFYHLIVPVILDYIQFESYLNNFLFLFVTVLPITLFVSLIFFVVFEKPFMSPDWTHNVKAYFNKLIRNGLISRK